MSSSATFFTILVLLSAVLPLDVLARGGFSIELIHRDSPKSPYYDSSATDFDRIRAASNRSLSRAAQIGLLHAFPSSSAEFQSQLIRGSLNGNYLMRLNLGSPPVERLLVADSGSNIMWTQCTPCINCYEQDAPIFNPAQSSTYKKVPYSSPACQSISVKERDASDNSCIYGLQYADQSHTAGTLSTETFGFDSTTGQAAAGGVRFPKLVFGCSTNSEGDFDHESSGLIGLGIGPISLINQLSSSINGKFSYCLVPTLGSSASSVMSFGDRAVVTGRGAVTTPLVSREPGVYYHVTLEYITVGRTNKKIAVKSAREFASNPGNVIIDSGSILTFLDEDVVSKLERQLLSVVRLPRATSHMNMFRLCFDSNHMTSDSDLPDMTFRYTGGKVKLSPSNTFISPDEGIMCLAILPNDGHNFACIGSIAQKNFHIGYDLHAMTLTFAPADCESL